MAEWIKKMAKERKVSEEKMWDMIAYSTDKWAYDDEEDYAYDCEF